MSGLETNLKSTRLRPGHYETKTETETLKIGLETFITALYTSGKEKRGKFSADQKDLHSGPSVPRNLER